MDAMRNSKQSSRKRRPTAVPPLEEQRHSSQVVALYAVGQALKRTAAAYRHRLANPVVTTRINLEWLENRLPKGDSEARERFGQIRAALDDIAESSKRFCAALPSLIQYDRVDLSTVVARAISEVHAEATRGEALRIATNLKKDVSAVYASELLQEHIYSLLANSVYAVSNALAMGTIQQGEILLETRRGDLSDKHQWSVGHDMIVLRITDNGTGVPHELEHNIGKSGFTTKQQQGMGYGLAAAKEYAQSLGGNIRWENKPGRGFVVELALQAYDEKRHRLFGNGEEPK